MNNPIISVVGLGKMGLGIYKRLCHENIILYGYDNNSKIIKNNTYVNFLEIEKLLEVYHRIIGKLMKLQEYESIDENGNKTVTLEELVHGAGLSFLGEVK